MAESVNELLRAYDPTSEGYSDRGLEVVAGGGAFGRPMAGGADVYFDDFSTGLRETVAAQRAEGGAAGAWFGGSGANPVGLVAGIDWMADFAAKEPVNGGPAGSPPAGPSPRGAPPPAGVLSSAVSASPAPAPADVAALAEAAKAAEAATPASSGVLAAATRAAAV